MKYFIAGTDTGVGKTIAVAALAGYFKAKGYDLGVVKAVQTGNDRDIELVRRYAGLKKQNVHCSLKLKYPLAPLQAAKRQNLRPIDIDKLVSDINTFCNKYELSLIEGSGGLYVPINSRYFMIDLIKKLKAKVVLVSRVNLGTINHTLLSVKALRSYKIPIAGIIYNAPAKVDISDISVSINTEYLARQTGLKTIAVFEHQTKIEMLKLAQSIDFV